MNEIKGERKVKCRLIYSESVDLYSVAMATVNFNEISNCGTWPVGLGWWDLVGLDWWDLIDGTWWDLVGGTWSVGLGRWDLVGLGVWDFINGQFGASVLPWRRCSCWRRGKTG